MRKIARIIGLLLIVGAVCFALFEYAYSEGGFLYRNDHLVVMFPAAPTVKQAPIGSPYGDVQLLDAEYNGKEIWLLARYAKIPAQAFVEQTYKDIAIRMLAPLEAASKKSIAHMEIVSAEKQDGFKLFATRFEKNGKTWFAGVLVRNPEAWLFCGMVDNMMQIEFLQFVQTAHAFYERRIPNETK